MVTIECGVVNETSRCSSISFKNVSLCWLFCDPYPTTPVRFRGLIKKWNRLTPTYLTLLQCKREFLSYVCALNCLLFPKVAVLNLLGSQFAYLLRAIRYSHVDSSLPAIVPSSHLEMNHPTDKKLIFLLLVPHCYETHLTLGPLWAWTIFYAAWTSCLQREVTSQSSSWTYSVQQVVRTSLDGFGLQTSY